VLALCAAERLVLAGFDESYTRMGVRFDHVQFESQTYKLREKNVDEGLTAGRLHQWAMAPWSVTCAT